MFKETNLPRRWLLYAALFVSLLSVAAVTSCGSGGIGPIWSAAGSADVYEGQATLEERIASAAVVARVKLLSVSAEAERLDGRSGHFATLTYRFEALEYLKGGGGDELKALAHFTGKSFITSGGAESLAKEFLAERDTRWDDREAIVFLLDMSGISAKPQADHYWFGGLDINAFGGEYTTEELYTISGRVYKRWLPAAEPPSAAAGDGGADTASTGGNQRFLLEDPALLTSGDSIQGDAVRRKPGTIPTITLSGIKARVATIKAEIIAAGGTEKARECVAAKHRWEREVQYMKQSMGGEYFYIRYDEEISSGLPAETLAFISLHVEHALETYGETEPTDYGKFVLKGVDEDLFNPRWPGVAKTARPLPTGQYRFYYGFQWQPYVICDAYPEDELKRLETFVTVTPPPGTLHEAFFDPVALASGVGASGSAGVLEPDSFSVDGTDTTISGLRWDKGSVVLTLSPYTALSGHKVDFIALDGSVSLSLDTDSATGDSSAGTLAWAVENRPWKAGDLLMLRISEDDSGGKVDPTVVPDSE